MNLEGRIGTTLRTEAGHGTVTPDGWERVLERADGIARSRRRQRVAVVALSTAAIVAAVAGVWLTTEGGGDRKTTPIASPPPATVEPGRIVGIDKTGELQVRSLDGQVIERLGYHAVMPGPGNLSYGWPRVSATRDGETVFVDDVSSTGPCAGRTRQVDRVHVRDGSVDRGIIEGGQPAVSPDGLRLAYVTYSGTECGNNDTLVVRAIEGNFGVRFRTGTEESVFQPNWSPDGTKVSVLLVVGDSERLVEVDVTGPQTEASFDGAREIAIPASTRAFGYISATEHIGLSSPEDSTEVVAFDATGTTRAIGVVPGVADNLWAAASPDGGFVLVLRQAPGGAVSAGVEQELALELVRTGAESKLITGEFVAVDWLSMG